jgi:uncharacterized protein
MKIALFGATGHAGNYILDEALKAGHEVTVLVRHPEKLKQQHDNLHVVTGDALQLTDVLKVVEGKDAVVSAISEGPHIQNHTQSVAVANMIEAMKRHGVKRIICMGAIGILQHDENTLLRDLPTYDELYKPLSYEHSAVNSELRNSGLDWTQVCPPNIIAAPSDGKFLVKADWPASKNMKCNAGNIGMFIMQELERNEFVGTRVGISNQ